MLMQLDETEARAGRSVIMNVIELDHATIRDRRARRSGRYQLRHRARRVHRRSWPQWRRQDDADARDRWALLPATCRQPARLRRARRGAAIRRSATCRRCGRWCPICGCAASISSPVPSMASAGACRSLHQRRPRHDRKDIDCGRRGATSPTGRLPKCPAASASACCLRRRFSASRSSSCSTSR